jgi:3',5'-cyclic-AMP phosphodiesterase
MESGRSEIFRVAQVTDPHLGQDGELPRGVDVTANLRTVLKDLGAAGVDHVVVTGDICYDRGDPDIYRRARDILDETGIPYSVLPGNHDNPGMLAEAFGISPRGVPGRVYYTLRLGPVEALVLDTAPDFLDPDQCRWISQEIARIDEQKRISGQSVQIPVPVFMHHPPVTAGVKFMDAFYPLKNPGDFFRAAGDRSIVVFCGHHHTERTVIRDRVTVQITPSTFYQLDPENREFSVESLEIGWRLIDVSVTGIRSSVRWLQPAAYRPDGSLPADLFEFF